MFKIGDEVSIKDFGPCSDSGIVRVVTGLRPGKVCIGYVDRDDPNDKPEFCTWYPESWVRHV